MPSSPSSHSNAIAPSTTPSPQQANTLAFLVHSPETVRKNLPPDVDNKPLARQKRRRTSKEDEDILKTEYEKNSKPDKATRLDIVSRVALGEKEVQIWFQNRRQNDRRRSQPSQTFELSSDLPDSTFIPVSEPDEPDQAIADADSKDGVEQASTQPESQGTVLTQASDIIPHETPLTEPTSSQSFASSQGSQKAVCPPTSYLANRRSASFIRVHEDLPLTSQKSETPISDNAEGNVPNASRKLGRVRSFVRLSTTSEGHARVITSDDPPSPPRSQPTIEASPMKSSLRRSISAAGLDDMFTASIDSARAPKIQRTSNAIGRSRDSRAWEFWCDSDARNSLTTKANQECSGSAADAIQLIRSTSRSALRSLPTKRNATLSRHSSFKHGKSSEKIHKSSLVRSTTSQGRLPSQVAKSSETSSKSKSKKSGAEEEFEILQTESDKENWSPEPTNTDAPSRRTTTHATQSSAISTSRRVLGENTAIMSQSNSLNAMMAREQRKRKIGGKAIGLDLSDGLHDTENANPEDDDEIAAFMGAARAGSDASVSSGEELAGVQGLLKLSQGRWGQAS